MTTKKQFSPLCDVHHACMIRMMLEEESETVRSYHICERRDCTRVFRDVDGYSDWVDQEFDRLRARARLHCLWLKSLSGRSRRIAEDRNLGVLSNRMWICRRSARTFCSLIKRLTGSQSQSFDPGMPLRSRHLVLWKTL